MILHGPNFGTVVTYNGTVSQFSQVIYQTIRHNFTQMPKSILLVYDTNMGAVDAHPFVKIFPFLILVKSISATSHYMENLLGLNLYYPCIQHSFAAIFILYSHHYWRDEGVFVNFIVKRQHVLGKF